MAEADLQRLFSANKAIEPDILSELESMMRLHDLSAEDLFFKWESYCIKMDLDAGALTLANARGLKQSIQDALEKAAHVPSKPERKVAATPRAGHQSAANGGDMYGMLDGLVPSTPASGGKLGRVPGSGGSGLRKKMEASKLNSSPAGGMGEQLKSMNGLP